MLIIFLLLQGVIALGVTYSNSVISLAWLGVVQIIISVIAIIKMKKELLSVSVIFVVFSFLLHMGQYVLEMWDSKTIPTLNIFELVSETILIETEKFVIYSHIAVVCGIIVYLKFLKGLTLVWGKGTHYKSIVSALNPKIMRIIAYVLIGIGLFFSIRTTVDLILLMLSGGYYNTFEYYNVYGGGLSRQLSSFWEVGVIILFFINRDNIKMCRTILLVSIGYLAITMLTGGRIMALMNVVTLLFCYFTVVEKLILKKIVILLVAGVFFIQYIVNIGLSRNWGFGTSRGMDLSINLLIEKVLAEFGGTSYSVSLVLEHVPYDIGYGYGITYPLSLFQIFPNFGWNSWKIMSTTTFTDYLHGTYTNRGIGGSYIAEAYYNCGNLGVILLFFFGIFLGWFDTKIYNHIVKCEWLQVLGYFAAMPYILMITRSFFKDMVRPFAWVTIITFIMYRLLREKREKT